MKKMFARFIRQDEGQDLIEFALLAGIITAVGIVVITPIAGQVALLFTTLCTAIGTAC
jgi:Flp pilus assembly pilin Flp